MNINLQILQDGAMKVSETDQRAYELITDLPDLQNAWAYLCLVLNILLPGSGTMLASILGYATCNKTHLIVGIL